MYKYGFVISAVLLTTVPVGADFAVCELTLRQLHETNFRNRDKLAINLLLLSFLPEVGISVYEITQR